MSESQPRDMRLDRFQLVDCIREISSDPAAIRAAARVPDEHSIFAGHFPGHPLLPGVLIGELMAQTSGFMLLVKNGFSRMPFLAAMKELNLRSFVVPGTVLECAARLVHEGSGYAVLDSEVKRAGEAKRVADARLTFRVTPFPNATLEAQMRHRAAEVGLVLEGNEVRLGTGDSR